MPERLYEEGNQGDQSGWSAPAGNIPGQGSQTPWTPQTPLPGNQGGGLLGGALGD